MIGLGILALARCSGMSGGSGGTAPGGAVGEAPSGSAISSGGSGTGSAPLPISAPAAAASGSGVLSSPVDDDLMGDCDPKAMLLYDKGYTKQFDADFEAGLPWQQISDQPFLGNFSVVAMGGANVSGMQVRAVRISADKSKVQYRDFLLSQSLPPHHPITVEFAGPAGGERLELYYFPLVEAKDEGPDDPACLPIKSRDFSETWVAMTAADYAAGPGRLWRIPLAAFHLQLFYKLERPELPEFDFKTAP